MKTINVILISMLIFIIVLESYYYFINIKNIQEKLENVQYECNNNIENRKIFISDLGNSLYLKKKLNDNNDFITNVSEIKQKYEGDVIFLYFPNRSCLNCLDSHVKIISNFVRKKKSLHLLILCNLIDYRKNLHYKSSNPSADIITFDSNITVDSDKPFFFNLGKTGINNLFFLTKNYEDFTEASVLSLTSN